MFKLRKLWWMVLISAAIALWYWQRQWTTRLRALPAPPPTTDSLAGSPCATVPDALIIDHEPPWAAYTEPAPPAAPAPPLDVVATGGGVSATIAPLSVTEPITGDTPDAADTAEIVPEQDAILAPVPDAAPADGTPDQPDARATAPDDSAPAVVTSADTTPDQIKAPAPMLDAASDGMLDQPDARATAPDDSVPTDTTPTDAPAPETVAPEPAPPSDVPVLTAPAAQRERVNINHPRPERPGEWEPGAPAAQRERVNINTASVKKLTTLRGIGPTLAQRIVAYRKANGPFTSVEGLLNVQGIGVNNLKDFIDRIQV